MSQKFALNINGQTHTVDANPDMPLLYVLRNDVGLNNPHFGCGLAQCGACTVNGWLMTAAAFLRDKKKPSEAEIKVALSGLKCRCGTHISILKAVKRAAEMMG
jgi:nicotinate dehydrogenase subunit A